MGESDRCYDRFEEKVKKAQIHLEKTETKLVSPQKRGWGGGEGEF